MVEVGRKTPAGVLDPNCGRFGGGVKARLPIINAPGSPAASEKIESVRAVAEALALPNWTNPITAATSSRLEAKLTVVNCWADAT